MSDDRNPKTVVEALENYLSGSKPGRVRSLEDDLPSELICRAWLPERATPRPEPPPPKELPEGYIYDPAIKRYQDLKASDPDFDEVRVRLETRPGIGIP